MCSGDTAAVVDKKVVEVVREQHGKARKIIQENIGKLHELAKHLYDQETITGEEFMSILDSREVELPVES